MRRFLVGLLVGAIYSFTGAITAQAQGTARVAEPSKVESLARTTANGTVRGPGENEEIENINNWTIGLAGGLLEGSYIKFAADLGTALSDGNNMRVLTVLTKGSEQNLDYLLYLRGIDAGLVSADTFDKVKKEGKIRNIEDRIQYISPLLISSLLVIARPEIKSFNDLEGKKVSIAAKGSSTNATSRKILGLQHINVEFVEEGVPTGLERMKSGEVAAVFGHIAKGSANAFSSIDPQTGFHFLPITVDMFPGEYYVPVFFTTEDFPKLISQGQKVESMGSPTVLAVYNWPRGTDRFRKVERFIRYYFERLETLKKPPYQPQWKDINLAATVPGWKRYWFADEMLKEITAKQGDKPANRPGVGVAAEPDQDKLFSEFLEWKKSRGQR